HTGSAAAQLRAHEYTQGFGTISDVAVFLHAHWTTLVPGKRGLTWSHEPDMVSQLYRSTGIISNDVPVIVLPFAQAAAHAGMPEGEALVCMITGEMLELLLIKNGKVRGRATIPLGHHT